jgi:hypothetical protein
MSGAAVDADVSGQCAATLTATAHGFNPHTGLHQSNSVVGLAYFDHSAG